MVTGRRYAPKFYKRTLRGVGWCVYMYVTVYACLYDVYYIKRFEKVGRLDYLCRFWHFVTKDFAFDVTQIRVQGYRLRTNKNTPRVR